MRKALIGSALVGILVLSGCSIGSSTEKQLSDVMVDMQKSEKKYKSVQEQLTELEKSEQQLFNETMELTQEQSEELKEKVAELKESLNKRKEFLSEEETAIQDAEGSSSEFETVITQADENEKSGLEKLSKLIEHRYESHSLFVDAYKELLKLQEELYVMLIDDDTQLASLKIKVEEVNAQNEVVQATISDFNASTGKVNEQKNDVFKSLKEE